MARNFAETAAGVGLILCYLEKQDVPTWERAAQRLMQAQGVRSFQAFAAHMDDGSLAAGFRLREGFQTGAGWPRAFFEELLGRYRDVVRKLCEKLTRDAATIDDAVQETILRLYNGKLDQFAVDKPFQPWLKTLARNVFVDLMRRNNSRRLLILPPEALPEAIDDEDLNEEEMIDWLRAVPLVIDRLPPEERQYVLLRFVEGLKPQEIRDRLNVDIKYLFKLRGPALQHVRQLLEEMIGRGELPNIFVEQ